jgi:hypothetical protein
MARLRQAAFATLRRARGYGAAGVGERAKSKRRTPNIEMGRHAEVRVLTRKNGEQTGGWGLRTRRLSATATATHYSSLIPRLPPAHDGK